jgi:hypothetical protein
VKDIAMQVVLLIHESADEIAARTDPARADAYWGAWKSYVADLGASGLVRGGAGLDVPASARVVRRRGALQVLDGPYAETREQLGGLFILEVDDIAQAQAWAERCPAAATGSVELRAGLPMLP